MLLVASFFIWLSLGRISAEDRIRIWETIVNSKKSWIVLSMCIGAFSHWLRAVRWNYLLKPLDQKISTTAAFFSIMAGYFANLGIPRTGEVLRASLVSKKEKVPFQQLFGTIITERLIDLIMLLSITGISVLINTELINTFLKENNIDPVKTILILIALGFCGYLFFVLSKRFKNSKTEKIICFINELIESIASVKKMPQKQYFIILTVFIWLCYIVMFFVAKYSIKGTEEITLSMIVITFVIGSFAMTISNGGLGAFPFSIATALIAFNIEKVDGEAFGWLLWSSQTALNIILGSVGLLYFTFFGKKNSIFQHSKK